MAGSINQVTLLGHLGRDPEVRNFQSGGKVTNLRLATSERWKDKQSGEVKERTEWHSIAVFGPLADTAEKYLRKGGKVLVQGQLRTRKWQDQAGADRYATEVVLQGFGANIVLLDSKGGNGGAGDAPASGGGADGGGDGWAGADDEIPF